MILAATALALSLLTSPTTSTPPPVLLGHAATHDREWSEQRPSRGGVGHYADSNVPAVWAGVPDRVRSVWRCIRYHESRHSGHYTAIYSGPISSTASGAGQWLDGTWRGLIRWVKIAGKYVDRHATKYPRAHLAPAVVQDAAFLHVYRRDQITGRGLEMWNGTGCPGT